MKQQSSPDHASWVPLYVAALVMGLILIFVQMAHVAHGMEMFIQMLAVLGIYGYMWYWVYTH